MPGGPGNIEDFTRKLKEVKVKNLGGRLRALVNRRRVVLLVILLLVVVLLLVIVPLASFYTEALWFNHIGFQNLFWKMFTARILMVVLFGAFFFALLYGNLWLARRIPPHEELDAKGSPLEEFVENARKVWKRVVGWGLVALSVVAGFVAGLGWAGKWDLLLKFMNNSPFGQADPVFGKDVGYYVFSYPFQRALVDWLLGSLIFVLVVTAVVYVLIGGIRLARGPRMFAPYVKAHLSILFAAIFLVKAWSYRLNMYELLFSRRGIVHGVGYADSVARIPALWIMLLLSIVLAALFLVNIWRRGWILPAAAIGAYAVVALVAGTIVPAIVQNYVVKPSERAREREYIAREINGTRTGYDINKVRSTPYPATPNLDAAAIEANRATINNIRLWDPRPLLSTNRQLQSIRPYYTFHDVDVDRYVVDGAFRQIMTGTREMAQSNLPESARTWVNETLVYTHGFGVVMNPSNDVTPEGNPNYVVKDIPPSGPTNLQVKQPAIYFGQVSNDYVVVNTTEPEFNYPAADREVRSFYKGKGGVRVNSLWRRFMFSLRFKDINLLLSAQVKNDSRVMYYRDIQDRLAKAAPFLKQDKDPYIVLGDDGALYWIADCYATTDKFPYSQPTPGLGNYVRNSVKAVIDAYDGTVTLYVFDPEDPLIKTYRKIFPQIFTDLEDMPEDLRRHVRYPEDLFNAQSNMLRTYHMTDPDQFYNKEDMWDFPNEVGSEGEGQRMPPFYLILKFPGETSEEMVLLTPFTPHKKQNMIAWLGARMNPLHYGEMVNFTFPSGSLVFGPEQIEGRIEQDPQISAQLSLWRQGGSQVIRGNLLVIPIQDSLLYVEPLYLQATQLQIPQLMRVVVVYNQQVAIAPTLDRALAIIFEGAPPVPLEGAVGQQQPAEPGQPAQPAEPERPAEPQKPAGNLGQQALDLYNRAIEAQKAGDWAAYGNYINELQRVLEQMANQ